MTRSLATPVRAGVLIALLALAGCASVPLHYYTLVPSASSQAPSASPAAFDFELLPVSVPAQVDQPQLVVRQGGQGVALLENERWIAPLGDEIRAAVSAHLAADLNSTDVSDLPKGDRPVLRVKLDVRRFEAVPGSYALLDAAWSVRKLEQRSGAESSPALSCTIRIRESVGTGYNSLVAGYQRALTRLSARISSGAPAVADGETPSCPAA